MEQLRPLLGTTLVLVAHPDDEVIACGALMQKMQRAVVVFATDGAPRHKTFWQAYGSRQAYADIRRQEARRALKISGACPVFLAERVEDGIVDQELFRNLPAAIAALEQVIAQVNPDAVLTLAYEGGHPDHDAACFMANVVCRRAAIPVWESPLYHRNQDGSCILQKFTTVSGAELELRSERAPLQKKIQMFHTYKSQELVLDVFRPDLETFRPMTDYDFSVPPLPWKLNYELWKWKMNSSEVSAAFDDYLRNEKDGIGP
jgi:LmbE family N-acetylglucosaminyl deacetylase